MDELIKELRIYANDETDEIRFKAADAIEQLIEECDAYRKAMTDEHNRAAKLAWEKEHCWIPVKEQLPEEGKFVLVYGDLYPNKHDGGVVAVSKRMDWNYWQGFGRERDITHWMPLPPAPKEE